MDKVDTIRCCSLGSLGACICIYICICVFVQVYLYDPPISLGHLLAGLSLGAPGHLFPGRVPLPLPTLIFEPLPKHRLLLSFLPMLLLLLLLLFFLLLLLFSVRTPPLLSTLSRHLSITSYDSVDTGTLSDTTNNHYKKLILCLLLSINNNN